MGRGLLRTLYAMMRERKPYQRHESTNHLDPANKARARKRKMAKRIEPARFRTLTVSGHHTSLRRLIDFPERYENCQPLFCFGLLAIADVPELLALLEDVTCCQPDRWVPPEPGQ